MFKNFIIGYIQMVKTIYAQLIKCLLLKLSSVSATDKEELGVAGLDEDEGLGSDEEDAEVEDGVDGTSFAVLSLPCRQMPSNSPGCQE
jgi:hypothetical protein